MSNYSPAFPTRSNYIINAEFLRGSSTPLKKIRSEEQQKNILFNNHAFSFTDVQVSLEDVNNNHFNRFLAEAVQYMEAHAPNELVQQALPYLRVLNEKTTPYDALALPPLSVSLPDERELLVEWNFGHFTIGFSFEINAEESSWYIVHDRTVHKMTGWGYLRSQTIPSLVNTILGQVVVYAP